MSQQAEDARDRREEALHPTHNVLDYGYVKFIESWGSDEMIIESARMSTGKGFLGWEAGPCPSCEGTVIGQTPVKCSTCGSKGHHLGDKKLLKFLYENKHSTPFEFAGLTLEVEAPLVVFREWHRHRTQSYSEVSARYTKLPDTNYKPTPERCLINGGSNRQASAAMDSEVLTLESTLEWLASLADVYEHCERVYQDGLKRGIPKELARLPVPVGRYSRMRATTDLRNWMGFLTLREAPNAQWEIRQYAHAVSALIKEKFPRTHALYVGDAK